MPIDDSNHSLELFFLSYFFVVYPLLGVGSKMTPEHLYISKTKAKGFDDFYFMSEFDYMGLLKLTIGLRLYFIIYI